MFVNPKFYAYLAASSVFEKLREDTQQFIHNIMFAPAKTASTREVISSEGDAPKVVSMEVPTAVPMAPRSPRPKPTLVRDVPKPKKDKKKNHVPVCKSPRKHATT